MSTFESDGYNDGLNGLRALPPMPYTFNGNTTNVHAQEYLRGWVQGRSERNTRVTA